MRSLSPEQRAYLDHLRTFDPWNRQVMLGIAATFGIPPSHLDIGCGTGVMVGVMRRLNVASFGVDLLVPDDRINYLMQADVSQPLDMLRAFDMVTCIEVAEHIDEDRIGVFAENIARHVNQPGLLILSAAGPGQGGESHKFLRPGYYWRTVFHDLGLTYREDYTNRLRLVWTSIAMPMMWLAANVQVFDR